MMKKLVSSLLILYFLVTFSGAAICDPNAPQPETLCNPITKVGSLPDAAKFAINILGQVIGLAAIGYLLIAGFRMVVSGGNDEQIAKAKSAFQWTISGFVLALFAYILIYAISDFVGVPNGTAPANSTDTLNPIGSSTVLELVARLFQRFLLLAGLVSMLLIIISGFRYITARGNDEQVSQAQKGLQWSVIGLIVILLSYVIVVATAKFFGAQVTTT